MSTHSEPILPTLQKVLNHLSTNPYPYVPTPPGCKKRASVAIIIRVKPAYKPVPEPDLSASESPEPPAKTIDDFFSQAWVSEGGEPEVLFIKRAGRAGDRWSGHVALPGGKRDPTDPSDISAAIRETREEVGLSLDETTCLHAGNLPERVVATTWGREALMVLCPYIFLLTSQNTSRVLPQPTEVASAHWVPLRALLSPNLRTREYVDTASRMAKQGGPIAQYLLRALVGRMVFSAVHLLPSESIYASSIPGFIPSQPETRLSELISSTLDISPSSNRTLTHQQPLLLWGLTLGVLADFLDMLPPHNAVKLWRYPTFTPPDLRALVWLFTRRLRLNNAGDLSAGTWPYGAKSGNDTAMDATSVAIPQPGESSKDRHANEVGIGGLGVGSSPSHAVGRLLAGYYERVNTAIVVFVIYRTILTGSAGWWLFKLWKRRSGR